MLRKTELTKKKRKTYTALVYKWIAHKTSTLKAISCKWYVLKWLANSYQLTVYYIS